MERRFFMNDFEQSLKDQADQFTMIPSKKVWHGIYNDLHPGRRWPSVTMSFLLIFTLVIIGHLNTHYSPQPFNQAANITQPQEVTGNLKTTQTLQSNKKITLKNKELKNNNEVAALAAKSGKTVLSAATSINQNQNNNLINDRLLANNLKNENNIALPDVEKNAILLSELNSTSERNIYDDENFRLQNNNIDLNGIVNEIIPGKIVVKSFNNFQPAEKVSSENSNNLNNEKLLTNKNIDKVIIQNKPADADKKIAKIHKKRNGKITWVYFLAPELSTVSFGGESIKPAPNPNFSLAVVAVNQKQNKLLRNSRLGFEAGAQMNYALAKKLQLTTGLHLTYSGYNIISNEVHPIFASLILRDPATGMSYARSFITHYGDGTGQTSVSLRNYSWQASIPLGLQYELWGNNKVQFNAGANVEPSLILKSNAYLLSSDGNNYVNDPTLLRKWNMSSNFNAFVTFRSSKLKWQVGPNVRYQWLSTYQKIYTVKEHLIDYGIRIGISK